MKDSRSGALGVASGIVLLLAKFAALCALLSRPGYLGLVAIALATVLAMRPDLLVLDEVLGHVPVHGGVDVIAGADVVHHALRHSLEIGHTYPPGRHCARGAGAAAARYSPDRSRARLVAGVSAEKW